MSLFLNHLNSDLSKLRETPLFFQSLFILIKPLNARKVAIFVVDFSVIEEDVTYRQMVLIMELDLIRRYFLFRY